MKKTITLLQKQHDVLADVIVWLDENKFSNTDIRSKVDVVLNHSDFYEIKATQEDEEFIKLICNLFVMFAFNKFRPHVFNKR